VTETAGFHPHASDENPFGEEPTWWDNDSSMLESEPNELETAARVSALVENLNPEQASAVNSLDGPLVVVAGPGSGKTRVLTHRIAMLVESGAARSPEILAVTFTNKAAQEMRERLAGLLGEETVRGMWVCTFHSFCAKLLRIEAERAGLPRAYSILDSGDARSILREIHRELDLSDEAREIKNSASVISRIKNGAEVRPDRNMGRILQAYTDRLKKLGALDFDDLLLRTKELLEKDPDIREKYQRRFSHILVDEYQDTNPVQYRIVAMLAAGHRNICVVGDADQSIYGFRSATPAALSAFTTDWPDAHLIILEENYRSTQNILEVCQAIIDQNPSEFRPQLRTSNETGEKVRLWLTRDDREEARSIVKELRRETNYSTNAILTRTNAQTRVIEDELAVEGVPYSLVGTVRFYERAEIKDALSYLRAVLNPQDVLAFARAASAPRRGIGPKSLDSVVERAAGVDLIAAAGEALADGTLNRGKNGWVEYLDALAEVSKLVDTEGPLAAVKYVVKTNVIPHVRKIAAENLQDRLENLEELENAAAEFETRHQTDGEGEIVSPRELTERFMENIALSSGEDELEDGGRHAVQLLTAHSSKGKEFERVYVMGVEEGMFPHARGGEVSDESEERRLLFVACSRAMKKLTITAAAQRYMHGKVQENPPSRFLKDLPSSVEVTDTASSGSGSWGASAHRRETGSRTERWGRPGGVAAERTVAREIVAPGPRLSAGTLAAGDLVEHMKFGRGRVTKVSGEGQEEVIEIAFTGSGTRQFKTTLAPLQRVETANGGGL
jgi:DNA helicase-2/ATP-dependent DNA helicase PcrA